MPDPMTPEHLAEIEARVGCPSATQAVRIGEVEACARAVVEHDAPALLAEVRRLKACVSAADERARACEAEMWEARSDNLAALATAWDQGHAASERDWAFVYDLATPDEDREPLVNPYITPALEAGMKNGYNDDPIWY